MNDFQAANHGGMGSVGGEKEIHAKSSKGEIADYIGSGEDAKNSFVWLTIALSFFCAGVISLLLFSLVVAEKDFKYVEEIKDVWGIFIPLITLALGYAFGKSQ